MRVLLTTLLPLALCLSPPSPHATIGGLSLEAGGDLSPAATTGVSPAAVTVTSRGGGVAGALGGVDWALMSYFFFWYLGNWYYNKWNKLALKAAGGADGFPMTIASMQLVVGSIYGLFLWFAPDARSRPSVTLSDVKAMLPVALCNMGAHCASVFSMSAGAVSFAQIVKASEPAFAAVVGTSLYGVNISKGLSVRVRITGGGYKCDVSGRRPINLASCDLRGVCFASHQSDGRSLPSRIAFC